MSQVRLTEFLRKVQVANTKFTESRSSLKALLVAMRQQVGTAVFSLAALAGPIAAVRSDKRGAKYAAALTYLESVWGKGAVEFKGPHQLVFAPLPPRLYVLKGSVIRFRGVDSGTELNHTFNANSASNDLTGEITANLVLAGVTYPVKAIVFELVPEWVIKNNFPGRSQDDLGVNEPLTLRFKTTPLNVTATQAGDPTWSLTGAAGATADADRKLRGKLQRSAAVVTAPIADGTAYFIAPWATTAGALMGPNTRVSTVTVRLALQAGASTGMFVEKTFTVHTPHGRMVQRAPYKHVAGKPSAGFTGDIFFDPKNVSFQYISLKEGRGTMVAKQTGFKVEPSANLFSSPKALPPSPSGYFAWEGARVHGHTPVWVPISGGDITNGSKLTGSDDVYTAPNPIWPAKYDGAYVGLTGKETDVPSTLEWPIFWKYQPVGIAADVLFQQVKHKSIMDRRGRVTTEKAGATVSYDV